MLQHNIVRKYGVGGQRSQSIHCRAELRCHVHAMSTATEQSYQHLPIGTPKLDGGDGACSTCELLEVFLAAVDGQVAEPHTARTPNE